MFHLLSSDMENELILMTADGCEVEPDIKEALRYMGFKGKEPKGNFKEIFEECLDEYKKVAAYKAVFRFTDMYRGKGNEINLGFCKICNDSLYKNLSGCKRVAVFAATSGIGVDRLIMRYSKTSPAHAVITDCIASSAIEVWCDKVNDEIVKSLAAKPRFSPGYGGVSLEYQKDVLSFLDAQRKLGISLNDALLMKPVKSVTAFVGICED